MKILAFLIPSCPYPEEHLQLTLLPSPGLSAPSYTMLLRHKGRIPIYLFVLVSLLLHDGRLPRGDQGRLDRGVQSYSLPVPFQTVSSMLGKALSTLTGFIPSGII
ncbi:hypothetical protein BV20DRAFT_204185 [Pilatotrama ljubarskyi]|nr:hypothetical protein BV20DRAFT_204185 [Pilatotrama ljubarskyi]